MRLGRTVPRCVRVAVLALCLGATSAAGQARDSMQPLDRIVAEGESALALPQNMLRSEEHEPWREAMIALPLAALLGAALAFRPVRRGTPARDAAVIQTQIVLAVVGALIMLVVGASLARAFGIVGAASLVRYRAKIADPKDAAVMLVALGLGLACGVGIYTTAAIGAGFVLGVLWLLESIEPVPRREYLLSVTGKDVDELRDGVESVLRRNRIRYELRTTGNEELGYDVLVPAGRKTDALSNAIVALDRSGEATVEWKPAKGK